jgi:hypothetical protein
MRPFASFREVLLIVAGLVAGCGQDPSGAEQPPAVSPEDPDQDPVGGSGDPKDEMFAVQVVLRTTLSLGGRGAGVLCPDGQEIAVGMTALVRRSHEDDRVIEEATLCGLDLPTFAVSANGALGGCDETREAQLALGFDVGAMDVESSLEAPEVDAGEALPMAFVIGATLGDPFGDDMPTWDTPELLRDDDADGQPGVTFVASGLPVLDEGAHLYGALRVLVTPTTDGHAEAGFALSLVGSNAGLSGRTLEVVSPRFDGGLEVEMNRAVVGEDATCEALLETPPVW